MPDAGLKPMQLNIAHKNKLGKLLVGRDLLFLACILCVSFPDWSTAVGEDPGLDAAVNLPALSSPEKADELVYVNFDKADIRMMLKTISDITGINFVVDDSITGTVTVISPTKIRLGEIYEVLESILDVKGYAAVPTGAGNLVKIIPRTEAAKRSLRVRIGGDPSNIPESDSLVTQIIPLSYANAAEVSQLIQPLLGSGLHLTVYPRTNSIFVMDTSSNIHQICRIIHTLDVPASQQKMTTIRLKYASAEVLSEQIINIINDRGTAPPRSAVGRASPTFEGAAKVLPDLRTNSLVIVADVQQTAMIKDLVDELDTQRPPGTDNVHVVYLENADAKEVADSLTQALANLKISGTLEAAEHIQVTSDQGTNSLIISASSQDFEVIQGIIEKLDIVREQVLVEMVIMEVSEDHLTDIGIDWATLDQAVEGSVRGFGATNFGPRVDFVNGDLEGLAVGAWKGSGSDVSIGAILHALAKESGVNILSTPHIMTSNHNKAKIIVGENRAFVTQSRITETTDLITPTVIKTFEYKDVGIDLEITPHISQSGLVRLEISSEFSKLLEGVSSPSADTPTTAQRQAETVVSMQSGSTVVIGGLIRDDKTTVESKIPLIGDLPLVGGLFRTKKDRLEKTNLLIFITPHVLSSQEDLDQITQTKKQESPPVLGRLKKDHVLP
jgi:general secretion pathway protein D